MASQTLIGAPAITQPGKLLRIVTRCATVDEFVTTFARFVDDTSIFVVMKTPRPIGPRQPFSMRLADGTPVLQGDAEVVESRLEGGEGRPGMRVRFVELDEASKALHARLRAAGDEAAAKQTSERAATQAGDYGTVEDSGLRFPPGVLTPESLTPPVAAPPAPAAPVLPTPAPPILPSAPTAKGLPPPGPRSSALPPMMPSSTLGSPLPPPMPQSVSALPPRLPATPPPPAAPLPPAPIAAAPLPPIPPLPQTPLPQTPTPIVSAPPLAPFATPVPPLGPSSGRPSTATGAARPKRNTQNSGIERAWQDSPPNVDEGYADDAEDGRRKQIITGAVTGVAGVLVGVLIGYLLFHRTTVAPAAPALAAAPAAADPAATPPPGGEPPATAAPGSEPPAAAPALAPPAADGAACKATIHSTPPGADVTIAGAAAGQTPLDDVAMPCGDQQITIARPRYETVTRSVVARSGEPLRLDERLARPSAMLELVSVPPGATFVVDGARSPPKLKVESFTNRTVTATLAGYKSMTKKIYVKGTKMRVVFKLERGSGASKPAPARKPAGKKPR